jgi:hypothetical protein
MATLGSDNFREAFTRHDFNALMKICQAVRVSMFLRKDGVHDLLQGSEIKMDTSIIRARTESLDDQPLASSDAVISRTHLGSSTASVLRRRDLQKHHKLCEMERPRWGNTARTADKSLSPQVGGAHLRNAESAVNPSTTLVGLFEYALGCTGMVD